MKDSNLNVFNKIIIATVLLLAIIVIYFNRTEPEDTEEETSESTVIPSSPQAGTQVEASEPSGVIYKNLTLPKIKELHQRSIGFNTGRYKYIVQQKVLVREFKNKIKLDINLPYNMHFSEIDLEDNVAGLYGSSHDQQKQMAVLATAGKVKMSDVLSYLETSGKALPLMESHRIDAKKIQTIPVPESTGLSSLKVIPTTDANGKSTFAAVGERKDGKGTYLFIMEAPSAFFQEQEGTLEMMLESVKANP